MSGRIVIEGDAMLTFEDSGMAGILEVSDGAPEGLFARIHSWIEEPQGDPASDHIDLARLNGARVRVTVEEIE